MRNFLFLLPLFNDWKSLNIVINQINNQLDSLNNKGEIIVVNDFSEEFHKKFEKFKNINHIKILNLKKNVGSQKAISIGLNYIYNKYNDSRIITVLDSDGEDDVSQIPFMINNAIQNPNKVIVSCRKSRKEKIIFRISYFFHKLITFLLTLKWISFGNYSSFLSRNIETILKNDKSWLAFSGCLAFNCKIKRLFAKRQNRLIGESKLTLIGLINHSLRINAVFFKRISTLLTVYISFFLFFKNNLDMFDLFFIFTIIFFYILIIVSLIRNKQGDFKRSLDLIKTVEKF